MLSLLSIFALPTESQAPVSSNTDLDVLNYALTLEHLEYEFYNQGLGKFDAASFKDAGYADKVYPLFQQILAHEDTHVKTLTKVIESLNGTAVPPCEYDFKFTDVKGFVATSKALETTGVSAYIGATKRITDKTILTSAASILSVEARHAAFLNDISDTNPFPNAFDISLEDSEVVSIASQFIVKCSFDLPKQFPVLTLSAGSGKVGDSVEVKTTAPLDNTSCLFLQGGGDNKFAQVIESKCAVPEGVSGELFIILTTSSTIEGLNSDTTVAGPASFEITK